MKKQIQPKDLPIAYPRLQDVDWSPETSHTLLTQLERQEAYLFKLANAPMKCPACNEWHTLNELLCTSKDQSSQTIKCSGVDLQHGMGFFGENYLTRKPK